uniref:Crinkler effector protein N-terminal domain-containing protein n=1 Tax=Globisporangium ultimum (strain ATCC 200006 / CBS 805.95 / DAOM BR144) TaxID=431595 RepID=K3WEK3_GLOUD
MVNLVCAFVGRKENTFVVQEEQLARGEGQSKRKNSVQCDADELKLCLAVKNDGDQAALEVENGAVSIDIQEMIRGEQLDTNWSLNEVLSGDNLKSRKPHQLHLLVVMPTPEPALQESKQVASKDDALDLLAQALRFVMPEIIEHKLVVTD